MMVAPGHLPTAQINHLEKPHPWGRAHQRWQASPTQPREDVRRVLLTRSLPLFVIQRPTLIFKLLIEYISITQAHIADKTHAPDHISLA